MNHFERKLAATLKTIATIICGLRELKFYETASRVRDVEIFLQGLRAMRSRSEDTRRLDWLNHKGLGHYATIGGHCFEVIGTQGTKEVFYEGNLRQAIDAAMKAERRPSPNKPESVKKLLGWMRPTVYEQITKRPARYKRIGRKP